jgi:hypothetical protein
VKPAELRRVALTRTLFIPGLLALASGAGLVAALVSDGTWDLVAWAAVGSPLAAIAWAWRAARG